MYNKNSVTLALTNFQNQHYLHSLDLLRGLAACAVMLYHFTIPTTITLSSTNFLKKLGSHGDWGVEVFFFISGLVIPYSLSRSHYSSRKEFFGFIKKRIIRIDVPYLATIILEIVLILVATLTPWTGRATERLDIWSLLLHLGYLNAFVGKEWLLPVFWTLAIEFQFYIFIALIFPWLYKNNGNRYFYLISFISFTFFFNNSALVFTYLIFFAYGLVIFYFKEIKISAVELAGNLMILTVILGVRYSMSLSLLMLVTAIVILFLKRVPALFNFLGKISFSIYLLHIPIGGRVLVMAEKISLAENYKMLAIGAAILITIMASYIFYIFVEKPSLSFAKSLSRRGHSNPPKQGIVHN